MSKKVLKQSVRIEHGQAVVVADIEDLKHIVKIYRYNGKISATREESDSWYRVADLIEDWIDRTELLFHDQMMSGE